MLELVAGEVQAGVAAQSIICAVAASQGIKLELFIFDTFPWAHEPCLMEVVREEEFAPVKNAPGAAADSPDTACAAVLRLHAR